MDQTGEFYKGFSQVSKEEWLKKIEADLKGKPLEGLFWELEESSQMGPVYHADDHKEGHSLANADRSNNDWEIAASFGQVDNKERNKQVLAGLMGGLNAIQLKFETSPTEADLAQILKGVEPNFISIHLASEKPALDTLTALKSYILTNYSAEYFKNLKGSICFEPDPSSKGDLEIARHLFASSDELSANFKLIQLSTPTFTDSKNISGDLAQLLAKARELFNTLGQDLSHDLINKHLKLCLEVGTDFFAELAKLRAVQILWANLTKAYNLKNYSIEIEVYFAENSLTEDANMNMIQASTQAMSAVLGGAQRLYIPLSGSEKGGYDFQSRIARNVQHLLKMESYLDRVVDPASGSYYIEALTEKIAESAWSKFQEIK